MHVLKHTLPYLKFSHISWLSELPIVQVTNNAEFGAYYVWS